MSWHVALHAQVIVKSEAARSSWREQAISPATLKGFDHEEWFRTFRPSTVEDHLREAAAWSRSSGHEFVDWRIEGIGIDLRGLLSEGNLPAWMGPVVATLRQAAAVGGVGKALFFGLAQPVAFELTMAPKKAKWRELTGPSIAAAGEQRIVAEITRLSRARTGDAGPALSATTEPMLAMEVYKQLGGNPARIARFITELERLRGAT